MEAETKVSDHFYYVFVSLIKFGERPKFFIVPCKVVAERVSQRHVLWLQTPGRNNQPHHDNDMRNFEDAADEYLEKWELLS